MTNYGTIVNTRITIQRDRRGGWRDFLGIELNPDYVALAEKRLAPLTEVHRLDTFFEEVLE